MSLLPRGCAAHLCLKSLQRKGRVGQRSECRWDGDEQTAPWTPSLGTLTPPFCHRDLKVSNLLMTDKGCVKTGGHEGWL